MKTGRNVFLTGAAGSGKTYVLRQYIDYLKGLDAAVGITASTGIAATHMGGVTIHSWSGLGIRESLDKGELAAMAEKRELRNKIKNASVLIVDEISMLHHYRLDMVDLLLREVRGAAEPFGGLQAVFCGDFFQLPPVKRAGEPETLFAYHAKSWQNSNLKVCYLSEQHRQSDDDFLEVLNAVRENRVSGRILEILNSRFGHKCDSEPTKLYSHNKNVNLENEAELKKISGKTFEYEMSSRGRKNLVEALKKSCLAPEILRLKVGAKVMFVKNNFNAGYVNGTLGEVVACSPEKIGVMTVSGELIEAERETWVIEEDGKIKAEISQYPLRLAWAITVHKSQGLSLDAASIDLSRSFERGMGYVALSRVRTLGGLFLQGLNPMALKVNEEVLEMDKKFRQLSGTNSFHITTMGNKKVSQMHKEFAEKIGNKKPKEKKLNTVEETRKLLDGGKNLKEIAKIRNLKVGTILDHLEEIKAEDPGYNIYNLRSTVPQNKFRQIYGAFRKVGMSEGQWRLAPVKETLGPKYSYDDLRLVRLFL